MSLRRFYLRIDEEKVCREYFFILNEVNENKDDECLNCYDKINNIENVKCHICHKCFHIECMESWFKSDSGKLARTCPHCRSKWKFEIDIMEKPIIIETDEFTHMPKYKLSLNSRNDRITINGSISGPVHDNYNVFRILSGMTSRNI